MPTRPDSPKATPVRQDDQHPASAPDRLPDGRDGRVVGSDDDSAIESMGKAIVAPVAGADGDAERPAQPLKKDRPGRM